MMKFVVRDLGDDCPYQHLRYQADRIENGTVVKTYGGPTSEKAVHNAQIAILMTESGVTPEAHARFIEARRATQGEP